MVFLFYLIFGFLPSLFWLLFYLRKDAHPESKLMVLKIFFYGILITLPALFLEIGISKGLEELNLSPFLTTLLVNFLAIALIEEGLKYLVVREKVISNPEFDEPVDAMIYMIVVALGFAALENILVLFSLKSPFLFKEIFKVSLLRFLGATFLHALCSGTVGYFLALSFFETKNRKKLLALGLGIATLLHGLYNFSIVKVEGVLKPLLPAAILIILAIFVSQGFKRLKKLKSICKINKYEQFFGKT